MNTPIDPPANEPNAAQPPTSPPVEIKLEQAAAAENNAEAAFNEAAKPDDKQKRGSVYSSGLRVCGNCGTELLGDTCYRCGQPTKGLVRQFSSIMGDFLDTVLNIDSRVFRTIGPLIYKPGFLTQEYFSGRRIRYVSPVRLFFFLAVLTFLLAQFSLPENMGPNQKEGFVQVNTEDGGTLGKAKTPAAVEKIRAQALKELNAAKSEVKNVPMAGAALEKAKAEVNRKADKRIAELKRGAPPTPFSMTPPSPDTKAEDVDEDGLFAFNGKDWDAEKNPIKIESLPDFVNKWFNSLAQRAENNGKLVSKEPAVIVKALLSALPMTLFLMLPVFAVLLKILFIFKRRLYMEHLIVALHSHAFLMLAILMLILFSDASAWLGGSSWLITPINILTTLLWLWMPIYVFLMQKRVYQQGWILTFIKFAIIGNLYLILLSIAVGSTLIFKMIWL